MKNLLLSLVSAAVVPLAIGATYFETDYEQDAVGSEPAGVDNNSFSPELETEVRVLGEASDPVSPLDGKSLYILDSSIEGVDGVTSDTDDNVRYGGDFNGGANLSAVQVEFDFTRGPADTDFERMAFSLTHAGFDPTSSSRRPFELHLNEDGSIDMRSGADVGNLLSTADIDTFSVTESNHLVMLLNSDDLSALDYDFSVGNGSIPANAFHLYINDVFRGEYEMGLDPSSSDIDFNAGVADLGSFAFYQDSNSGGSLIIDNIKFSDVGTESEVVSNDLVEFLGYDYENGEIGGNSNSFSPELETNIVVLDDASDPVNPLEGRSLYVLDSSIEGVDGVTSDTDDNVRYGGDFNGGLNVAELQVSFDFTAGPADANFERIAFSLTHAGFDPTSSSRRPFELHLNEGGSIDMRSGSDVSNLLSSSDIGSFSTSESNRIVMLFNSDDTSVLDYDLSVGSGSISSNSFHIFINGIYSGEYEIGLDPTSEDIDFNAGIADLGSFAFYQDSNSGGSLVIDNLSFSEIGFGEGSDNSSDPELNIYSSLDFEDDTVDTAPVVAGAGYTPGSNGDVNGAVVIDASSTPVANPLSGQSMYVYDLGVASGESTHFRYPFNGGVDVSNVRVDFDFQRGYGVVAPEGDTGIHVAVGRSLAGALNNSDFRPFRLSLFNDGTLSIDDLSGITALGTFSTDGEEHVSMLVNSHDTQSVDYDLSDLGIGTVLPNSVHVFLNDAKLGEFDFFVTPDPTNAPQIVFDAENNDLGQIAFFQDTNSEGGFAFDNVIVKRINDITEAPAVPSGLTQDSVGPQVVTISWTDNASDETGFIIERKTGDDGMYEEVGTTGADEVTFSDSGLDSETTYSYQVIATNGLDSDPSEELSITTTEQIEPLIVGSESASFAIVNTSALLEVTAIGRDPLSYQWYLGESGDVSSPVSGATSSSFDAPVFEENVSYWVQVTNDEGSFDSDTFEIEVSAPSSTVVSTLADLDTAIAAALPGDEIIIANGEYDDWLIEFEGAGLESAPITLRAETAGEVIFKLSSRLEIGGEWLVVDGLVFTGEYTGDNDEIVQFRSNTQAENCRMTNVSIIDYIPSVDEKTVYVALYGVNNRVDHCYFTGHDVLGVTMIVWLDGIPDYHLIDYNHFANRIDGDVNGWETIRIGTSSNSTTDSFTTVEHNLFEHLDGEIEIISNKCGGNVYRYNTFLECRGTLTLRHGDGCLVEGNYFLGGMLDETGGVRVIGRDHVVINNYFSETTGRDGAAITVYAGVENSPLNEYFSADNTLIAFNTFYDNEGSLIDIGAGFGSRDRTVLPTGVVVTNNIMDAGSETSGTFITGENPGEQTWAGNIYFGRTVGGSLASGFTEADPMLELDLITGIRRPSVGSPAIDASSDVFDEVDIDIDGQDRDDSPDVGADELSDGEGIFFGPTSAIYTGPSYLGVNRVLGEKSLLMNQSVRAQVTAEDGTLIGGFVIDGEESKTMLIRGVGPSLSLQNVESPIADPILLVYNSEGVEIYRNDDWGDYSAEELTTIGIASSSVGAFDLEDGSADALVLEDFAPGIYTAHVVSVDGSEGEALLELYDVSGENSLVNQSSRANICEDVETCITGFAIADGAGQTLLIRGVGPGLSDLDVADFIADVKIEVFDSDGNSVASNDDWSGTDIADAASDVGAFDLVEGSKDAALLISLEAGQYTVHATGASGEFGVVLVETYVID